MAPRANWKGFLRLSLVTCPIALFPATSESEKVRFNQINKKTGHRVRYVKVDAETGEEVANEDIVKGYKIDTDSCLNSQKTSSRILLLSPRARSTSINLFHVARSMTSTSSGPIIWCRMARSATMPTP